MRQPDYTQILKVLRRQKPDRPTLFELFLNDRLYKAFGGEEAPIKSDGLDWDRIVVYGFKNAGYDYATVHASRFGFPTTDRSKKSTLSLNDGFVITDWASFESYPWPNPADFDCERLEKLELPEGMKLIVFGPSGVLENTTNLVGYDNLCMMLYDDPELARCIFDHVGERLLAYYKIAAQYDNVCAIMSNDDWGFKTQTMISPADMRKYVFPWHKKIVEAGHAHNKPVILHSCGDLSEVMEDVIEDIGFDAKHSFEDTILPIEDAYERYKNRIALLGGMDVHFVCTRTPAEITARAAAMLERAEAQGGYALGTGNSVPLYVPDEGYLAMTRAALG